jgi:hypothetical protein
MHILGAKPFALFLESKKPNAFRVEARLLHLLSRTAKDAIKLEALRESSSPES